MSPYVGQLLINSKGVPRASGDEPVMTRLLTEENPCSPRERG